MATVNRPLAVLRFTWKDSGPMGSGSYRDAQFAEMFTSSTWWWGIAKFWTDISLGTWDCCTNSRVFPWRVLPLDQKMGPNPEKPTELVSLRKFDEIMTAALEVATDDDEMDFDPGDFAAVVVFMDPPPSDSHGSPQQRCAVVDRNGSMAYLAHEVGHALTMQHSGDAGGKDYGDPYCMMSGVGPYTFSETTYPDADVYHKYWEAMGPMTAAATMYSASRDFAQCASVVHAPPNARDTHHPITLRAFSKATLGDPVLAVLDVDGQPWTAEYRATTGWDRALPGNALVLHTIRSPPPPGESAITRYVGKIAIPFYRGVRDWEANELPMRPDLGVVIERADEESVTFQFRRKKEHAVKLDREVIVIDSHAGPTIKASFPVWNGLCGEQEFEHFNLSQKQRIELVAETVAYIDPAFKWRVNSVDVVRGRAINVEAETYVDDGLTVKSQGPQNVSVSCRDTDDATPPGRLAANILWLENDPKSGIFDVSVEVEVSDQGSRAASATHASVNERFESGKQIIVGKEDADRKCKNYWAQLSDKLPRETLRKKIDKGDPIWRFLRDRARFSGREREELEELIILARALQNTKAPQAEELIDALSNQLGAPKELITR